MFRRLLLVLLLFSFVSADFIPRNLDVFVTVNEDGTAYIVEQFDFLVTGSYHLSLYETGIPTNNLASWATLTGLNDVRYHVDSRVVDIQNQVIGPQPLSRCNPLEDTCYGQLIITYTTAPYYTDKGITEGTGVVFIDSYKPRTKQYVLNSRAFVFEFSQKEDIILNDITTLTLEVPEGSVVVEVKPLPENFEGSKPPFKEVSYSWSNTILPNFSFIFEKEGSLDSEITAFFLGFQSEVFSWLSGEYGLAIIILVSILLVSYFYLTRSRKGA